MIFRCPNHASPVPCCFVLTPEEEKGFINLSPLRRFAKLSTPQTLSAERRRSVERGGSSFILPMGRAGGRTEPQRTEVNRGHSYRDHLCFCVPSRQMSEKTNNLYRVNYLVRHAAAACTKEELDLIDLLSSLYSNPWTITTLVWMPA